MLPGKGSPSTVVSSAHNKTTHTGRKECHRINNWVYKRVFTWNNAQLGTSIALVKKVQIKKSDCEQRYKFTVKRNAFGRKDTDLI